MPQVSTLIGIVSKCVYWDMSFIPYSLFFYTDQGYIPNYQDVFTLTWDVSLIPQVCILCPRIFFILCIFVSFDSLLPQFWLFWLRYLPTSICMSNLIWDTTVVIQMCLQWPVTSLYIPTCVYIDLWCLPNYLVVSTLTWDVSSFSQICLP